MNQKEMNILLVAREASLSPFEQTLVIAGAEVTCCGAGRSAEEMICENNYAAVAVDEHLLDGEGLDFVRQWTKKYPLVNFALVSDQPADDFHEITEGLGIFMQLHPHPDEKEAEQMLGLLSKINCLMEC